MIPPRAITIGPVTVTFTWTGDRWSHEVVVHDVGRWRSVEGPRPPNGDDRWPASPVLVELSSIETARGPTILGVGRAGRSHFSASIGPDPRPGFLLFEIACRVTEPPVWLGSTYEFAGVEIAMQPAAGGPAKLPATVEWGYSFGAAGLAPCDRPRNWSDS